MHKKNLAKYLTLFFSALLSLGCSAEKLDNQPHFNTNNQSGAFFEVPLVIDTASDFMAMQEKTWDFATDLKHNKLGTKAVSNCLTLKKLLSEGFTAVSERDNSFVGAQSAICSMWEQMGKFKPYNTSFMSELTFNKDFATLAPARLALLISNEQIANAKNATSWNEASNIKEVKSLSEENAIFYDDSGSIQRLTLMAKGDYNSDGFEDRLLYMENSVEGGSYSSTKIYVVTRLTADGSLSLLKEI